MTEKQLTPRQADRRQRILEATRDLLADAGYEGLQMRLLAERAGVAPMTLYNLFGNKDDLILVALRDMLGDIARRAQSTGKRGIELLVENVALTAEQILTTPKYAQAMALMLFNAPEDSPIAQTLLINNVEQSRRRISEMLDAGEVDDTVDSELLARSLAVCGWAVILLWIKGVVPDAEFRHQYQCAPLLVLAPAMTKRSRLRYAARLKAIAVDGTEQVR